MMIFYMTLTCLFSLDLVVVVVEFAKSLHTAIVREKLVKELQEGRIMGLFLLLLLTIYGICFATGHCSKEGTKQT